jgi:hypothetical protein
LHLDGAWLCSKNILRELIDRLPCLEYLSLTRRRNQSAFHLVEGDVLLDMLSTKGFDVLQHGDTFSDQPGTIRLELMTRSNNISYHRISKRLETFTI